MGKLFIGLVFLALVSLLLTVALFQWLGWVGVMLAMAGVVILGLILKRMAGRILKGLFMAPFKMKGAVLRGAEVQVHAVTPAPEPIRERSADLDDPDEVEEQPVQQQGSNRYFYLDVTITPQTQSDGGFTMWEPGELVLAPPDAKDGEPDDEAEAGNIEAVQIWHEGVWHDDEGEKYHGPQRLRLLVGIPPEITRARFRYYFEVFGELGFALVAQPDLSR